MFWQKRELTAAALALLSCAVMGACDKGAPVATGTAQAAVHGDSARAADLRCLTRRPEDCLTKPVSADEPHGAICATCHDMWQNTASHSARSCDGGGCHDDVQKLSRFHRTLRPRALTDCTHCHRPHDFRVTGDGRQCTVCHQGGGQRVVWGNTPPAVSAVVLVNQRTSFWHSDHAALTCVTCHGVDGEHMTTTVRAPQDCRSCHHSEARSQECLGCHSNDKVFVTAMRVTTALSIHVGALQQPKRVLSFEHALHGRYDCTECHKRQHGIPSARGADCSSCHLQHHTASANCSACHERPARGAHNAASHTTGCSGAGCHVNVPAGINAPPHSRQVCLACHTDRRTHEGGRNCSECHLLKAIQ